MRATEVSAYNEDYSNDQKKMTHGLKVGRKGSNEIRSLVVGDILFLTGCDHDECVQGL
jgi:hypothetical protein